MPTWTTLPCPHQGDAVGHEHRFLGVVGDDQRRDAAGLQHVQGVVAHLVAQPGVEGGEGLVEQQHLRAGRQRPGQRHPLLLAAGEHVRVGAGIGFQADAGQRLGHLPAALAAGTRRRPKATFSATVRCGNRA